MRDLLIFVLALLAVRQCVAPPVTKNKENTEEHSEEDELSDDEEAIQEYHRYLKEVVQTLESDDDFRRKLENATEDDIRTGKIADHLDFLHHNVRTRLDEIKRIEIERLRRLATDEYERANGIDSNHPKTQHLDHSNPHTFEVVDLKKLIIKTTQDLAEADRKRRKEFQEYEMQKKFHEEEKIKSMSEEEKKKYAEEQKVLKESHKKHEPLHHPGSKPQLEEVWKKQDHMESQKLDLRTFFYLHDIDGNGIWDPVEVNALFVKELNKVYAQGGPETDVRERIEEMERMREHIFREIDTNKDGLISVEEFIDQSRKPEFEKDEGWETLDEQQIYTEEDYQKYEKRMRDMQIAKGISPPHHGDNNLGHQQQFAPHYDNIPVDHAAVPHQEFVPSMGNRVSPNDHQQQQNYVPQASYQQQQFPGQIPLQQQQFQGHVPQQQFQDQQHVPQYQQNIPQYQGQNIPQYQGHQQAPQYQGNPNQAGQVHQYQGQVPIQQQQQHQQQQQQHQQQQPLPVQTPQQSSSQGGSNVQEQRVNVPSNNHVRQQTDQNTLPVVNNSQPAGNSARAIPASPNVVQT